MVVARNDSRAELSRLLRADAPATEDCSKPPDESSCIQLCDIVALGVTGSTDDQRVVYEHLPLLLLRFFGFAPGSGWLETGSSLPHAHREILMHVVRPEGPLAEYCVCRSPPLGSEPKDDDWRFEFPLSNLPTMILDDFYDVADGAALPAHVASALAPMLAPCLRRERDGQPAVLLLSPIEYFTMCLVASPTLKWTPPSGSQFVGTRRTRPRRSASLPSTRAMYNSVLTAHVTAAFRLSQQTSGGNKSLLLPACADLLFAPMTGSFTCGALPEPSTPTVDSLTSVLLALRPGSPSDLILSSGSPVGGHIYPSRELATAAMYAMTQEVLRTIFTNFPTGPSGPLGTLSAYVRLLALYLTPWKESVVSHVKAALYPKPRPNQSSSSTSPSLAIITSKLSSFNEKLHLPTGSKRSSPAKNGKGEAAWRDLGPLTTRRELDRELLRLAIVKCANCRLCTSSEGVRALSLLAESVRASGLALYDGAQVVNVEEVRGCLHALSDQVTEAEMRSGRKNKSFLYVLGNGLGVKIETFGVLSGVAEMVGVGGAAAGVVEMMTSAAGSATASSAKRRLRDRRRSELQDAHRENVPLLGNVWDIPIESREMETAVVLAYRVALWLEPRLGFLPNTRVLGRKWVVYTVISVLLLSGCILLVGG